MAKPKVADHIHDVNAYTDARKIFPGCQHMLGCKCTTPFWLRDPTMRELNFERRILTAIDGRAES